MFARRTIRLLTAWAALAAPFALALAGVAVGPPSVACAQPQQVPRVVVLRFTGWNANDARQIVAEGIAPFVELVDEERAVYAAQDLGVDVSTPEGMQQVVEHLGISLVIAGGVEGRGRAAETQIFVVDSAGEELAQRTGPAPTEANRRALGTAAISAIEAAQAALAARNAPPDPEPDPDPDPALDPDPDPEPDPEPTPDEAVAWRQPYFLGLAGVRLRNVSTHVVNEGGGPDFLFLADAYPEIDLMTVIRPLAGANDASRGLLFGLAGSFSVGISYVGEDGNARGMTSFGARLDVGYGYVLGDLFELVAKVGFGVDGVLLDDASGFASATYSYLRPALEGRIRAFEDLVVVELGFGGRIGLDGGDLAAAFGPSLFFGGVDVFLGLTGAIAPGFAWSARIGYVFQSLSFDGPGGSLGNGAGGSDEALEGRFLIGAAL